MQTELLNIEKLNMKKDILSPLEKLLFSGLITFGIPKEDAIAIMLGLQDSEELMEELLFYIRDNQPNPRELMRKSIELVIKAP